MTLFDQLILLLTGLTAIYLIFRFVQDNKSGSKSSNTYYIIAFAVLLVSGLLLIFNGYEALQNPLVVVVAYLIPLGISLGLVAEFYSDKEKLYLVFGIVGLVLIFLTRVVWTNTGGLATIILIIFHSTAGLIIFFTPICVVRKNMAPGGFIWVTVGGALIGLGGIALAFLKTGKQLLFFSQDFVFAILAPLLLLMALAYTYGFMKKMKA